MDHHLAPSSQLGAEIPGGSGVAHLSNAAPSAGVKVSPVTASRRRWWIGSVIGAVVLGAIGVVLLVRGGTSIVASHKQDDGGRAAADGSQEIPVNTVRPRKKTLERILEQPGSIQPIAEAELYAKAAGYLKRIQRSVPPKTFGYLGQAYCRFLMNPVEETPNLLAAIDTIVDKSPEKDIGSRVVAGEILMEVSTPERLQEIVEKQSMLQQREAELESARAALSTYQAAIEATKAFKIQAGADVRKAHFEYSFRSKELERLRSLVESGSITPQAYAERKNQVDAALAAWEASQAKVKAVEADMTVATARLSAATSDLRVKELLVQVARDALRQAEIAADYRNIRAPFNGIITYRGVDEGDFVQNATSGQARRLMTVAAIDKVKVAIDIPERDTPWVRVGSEAVMALDAFRGGEAVGHVARIANALDPVTRTMRVEIDMDNPERKLLPGMYGQVRLILQKITDAQAIPATALFSRRGENYIILVQNGVAHRQLVRVRYDDGREVEVVKIIDGREVALDGTEDVVVSNKGEIGEGQRIHAIRLNGK